MEGTQDDRPKPTGEQLMLEMLENIVLMNKHLHEGKKRTEVLVGLLDELLGSSLPCDPEQILESRV